MSRTVDDLISACFDEIHAIQHYQDYAQKAADEGYPEINKLSERWLPQKPLVRTCSAKGLPNILRIRSTSTSAHSAG